MVTAARPSRSSVSAGGGSERPHASHSAFTPTAAPWQRASSRSLGTCTATHRATSVPLSPNWGNVLDPPGAGAGLSRHHFLDILSDFLFFKYENNISLCLCRERSGWVCSPASGRASNVLCRVWKGWLPPALLLMTLAAAADLARGPYSPRWFSSHLSCFFPPDLLPPGQR